MSERIAGLTLVWRACHGGLVLVALLAGGCGWGEGAVAPATAPGEAGLAVSADALSSADIGSVQLTISGPVLPQPFVAELTADGVSWTTFVTGIPAGQVQLDLVAYGRATPPAAIYSARALVDVPPSGTLDVSLVMQQAAQTVGNALPVVDSLAITATSVSTGGTITAWAAAHDPDPGDGVHYAWSASCGTLTDPSLSTVTWTAPAVPAICRLSITVRDDRGGSVTTYIDLTAV
jgi:hypothetical protein